MWDPSLPGQIAQSSLRFSTPQERRAFIAHASQGDPALQAQALQILAAYESGNFTNPALQTPVAQKSAVNHPEWDNPALSNPAHSNPALSLPGRPLPAMPTAAMGYPQRNAAQPKGNLKKTLLIVGGIVGGVALVLLLIASPFLYRGYGAWKISSTKTKAEETRKLGKFAESAEAYQKLLALYQSKLGNDDATTIETMVKLGDAYSMCGKKEEAVSILTEAAEKQQNKFGPLSSERLSTLTVLAGVLRKQQRFEEELKLWETLIQSMKAANGANPVATVQCLNQYIEACITAKQRTRSIAAQEELVDFFRQNAGAASPQTLDFVVRLIFGYTECGKPEKAIALGEANIATVKQVFGANSRQSLTALECLAKACDAVQRADDATRWRQQHEEAKRAPTEYLESGSRVYSGSY